MANKIVMDIPLEASMPEAVEIFKQALPQLDLTVKDIESDSPTIKLEISRIESQSEKVGG